MAKSDTLFMTKTAEKPYPLGAAHTYIAHIREYPGVLFLCMLFHLSIASSLITKCENVVISIERDLPKMLKN